MCIQCVNIKVDDLAKILLQRVLKKLDPESLADKFEDARKRGPGWRKSLEAGQ